ncbi:MAG: WD40 repeat domain-containing protein, partial [Bacteroidia bacterium]
IAYSGFASGSADGMIVVWHLLPHHLKFQAAEFAQDLPCQKGTLVGHSGGITCLASLSLDYLASGSLDKTIRIWNLKTMDCCIQPVIEFGLIYHLLLN